MSKLAKFEIGDRPANIGALFDFLKDHSRYNRQIQVDDIRMTFSSCDSVDERAKLLLFKIYNTQSQPKLDEMNAFFCRIERIPTSMKSLASFSKFLADYSQETKKMQATGDLFTTLSSIAGWGPKTAALFLRNLALIQLTTDLRDKFWSDVDGFDTKAIQLPVDRVIREIFSKVTVSTKQLKHRLKTFESINKYLKDCDYSPADIVVWDDLWFWGYITQKVPKNETDESSGGASKKTSPQRSHEWNESKYWSIFTAPKGAEHIAEIKASRRGKIPSTAEIARAS